MAYYSKFSQNNRTSRKYYDTWEEEGSRYSGASRRGSGKTEGSRKPGRQDASRTSNRNGKYNGYGEHFPKNNPSGRTTQGRGDMRFQGQGRPDRYAKPRSMPQRAPQRAIETEEPSYRDFEYAQPIPLREENLPAENMLVGRNPIREALKSGRDLEKLMVARGELSGSAREIVHMAREAKVPVQEVDKSRLDDLAQHHQGMIAYASAYQYATVEDILAVAKERKEDPFIILLDGVTDPHNLGAVIRTAECAGAHGVIVPERRSVGLTPAAVKASAGAVEFLKVARVPNLTRTLEELKAKGIWVYALSMDGDDYETVNFKGGTALVIGSEGEGISRLVAESCDKRVSLPLKGHIESLNASVAAGIVMYRVVRSRAS